MRIRVAVVGLLAVAAAACGKKQQQAPAVRVNYLFDVPYLAKSVLVDTTGSPEAQHLALVSPQTMDSVATFYRNRLPAMGWQLLGGVTDTGSVSLYFERSGLPMWIQIVRQGPSSSRISFTAAGGSPAKAQGPPR